ncbi:F-box/LRR-repeat protein At3g48880-like [Cicer arietinum]|uniref:F-box/LRR-repeat protein At3g48880-like n=1 Tax=Cicer arietinum TaxID=3827 RepID=A0A1S2Y2P8_CICAR|nr:F-box/LRR-repeat protein At3g48880-like [Cicer arietinum]
MKKRNSCSANGLSIQHLYYDILVRIFMNLNVVELSIVSMVSKSWNHISRDPLLWAKLDLSRISPNAFNIPSVPEAWSDTNSSNKLTTLLKYALSLSNYNTTCIVFNYFIYLTDAHLVFVAERTPNLKRLVLPFSGKLSSVGVKTAMKSWRDLQSITITSVVKSRTIFSAIRMYYQDIIELKFTCNFEIRQGELLVKYTPNLRALSLRNVMVNLRALLNILNSLEKLEEVNICHSLIWDRVNGKVETYTIHDVRNRVNLSLLQKLIFCQRNRCLMCKNVNNINPRRQPYVHFEDLWHQDEIRSLGH